jgi:hypothetical protein
VCVCLCLSVTLVIQNAMRRLHTAICGVLDSTRFFHVISQTTRFLKESFLGIKCRFRFSLQIWSETFLTVRELSKIRSKMYIGLRVKYPLFSSDFNETLVFSKYLRKNPQTKFHENLFSGSRVVPRGQTDGQT